MILLSNSDSDSVGHCHEVNDAPIECNLTQFERNKYFYGKLMTVADFEDEQRYFNGKRHLINRNIHGRGIVCGLHINEFKRSSDNKVWQIDISEGWALDCCGREIVVGKRTSCPVSTEALDLESQSKIGLYIRRKDNLSGMVPSLSNSSSCEEVCCHNRIKEGFELFFDILPAHIRLDKKLYPKDGVLKITIVDPSTSQSSIFATVKSLTSGKGIPVSLNKQSESNEHKGSIELTTGPSPDKLQVEEGDLIAVNYGDTRDEAFVLPIRRYTDEEKRRIGDDYFRQWLTNCPACSDKGDPRVLVAVITISGGSLSLDNDSTSKHRDLIYSNPMLYDLISNHIVDYQNPHDVTAKQIGALKTIKGVGNKSGEDFKPNVDLTSDDDTIKITGEQSSRKVDFALNDSSVKLKHLRFDFQGLDGINITKDVSTDPELVKFSLTSEPGNLNVSSGLIDIGSIEANTFILRGPFDHKAGTDTPPKINLGRIDSADPTHKNILHMEDLDPDFAEGMKVSDDEETQKLLRELDLVGLANRNRGLVFRALKIDNTRFHVAIWNNGSSAEENVILRFYVIPAEDKYHYPNGKDAKEEKEKEKEKEKEEKEEKEKEKEEKEEKEKEKEEKEEKDEKERKEFQKEKERDDIPIRPRPNVDEVAPRVVRPSSTEEERTDQPAGNAFIRPEERPEVGRVKKKKKARAGDTEPVVEREEDV
jgi:hypothetical protein